MGYLCRQYRIIGIIIKASYIQMRHYHGDWSRTIETVYMSVRSSSVYSSHSQRVTVPTAAVVPTESVQAKAALVVSSSNVVGSVGFSN